MHAHIYIKLCHTEGSNVVHACGLSLSLYIYICTYTYIYIYKYITGHTAMHKELKFC